MEFVIVTCDNEERAVFIDNQEQGLTDSRLSVPEGLHVFDLGAPQNYAPPFQELLIENTTPGEPIVIPFTLMAREAAPRKRPTRKAKRTRSKAGKASAARKSNKRKSTKKRSTKRKKSTNKTATKKQSAKATSRKKR